MKTSLKILLCTFVSLNLLFMVFPVTDADVLNIGTEQGKNGLGFYEMSSGFFLSVKEEHLDYAKKMFDGNLSTGVDVDLGAGAKQLYCFIDFPYPVYVHNITVKPFFNGSSSPYYLDIYYKGWSTHIALNENKTNFYYINCTIEGVYLLLEDITRTHFYFNDVIINYTRYFTNLSDVEKAFNYLTNKVDSIDNKLNDLINNLNALNNKIDNISDEMDHLQGQINDLNRSYLDLNRSFERLVENLTDVLNISFMMSSSLSELSDNYNSLNDTVEDKIMNLNDDLQILDGELTTLKGDLLELRDDLENGTTADNDKINDIEERLNQSLSKINTLDENITLVKGLIPPDTSGNITGYDDTELSNHIDQLETENALLKQELENLSTALVDLNSDVDRLETEKDDSVSKDVNKDNYDQQITETNMIIIVLVIIACTIILSLVIITYRKRDLMIETPPKEFEMLNEIMFEISKENNLQVPDTPTDEIMRRLTEKYNNGEISKEAFEMSSNQLANKRSINYLPAAAVNNSGSEGKP